MKRKNLLFAGVIYVMVGSITLSASTDRIYIVDDAVRIGLKNSPHIKAQQHILESKKVLAVKLGSLDEPKIGIRFNGLPAKKTSYQADQKRYFVNQSFPFLGELDRKKQLGTQQYHLAQINYKIAENNFVFRVKKGYYQLVLNESLIGITKKYQDILEKMVNIADIKYRSGSGLQGNVLKAEVSKGKLDEQLFQLQHQKIKLQEEFQHLLGVSEIVVASLNYSTDVRSTSQNVTQAWVDMSLTQKRAELMGKVSTQKKKVQEDRYLPNFSAQLEYWDNAGIKNQYGGQIGMTVPWFNSKNEASVKEADLHRQATLEQETDQYNLNHAQLKILLSDINTTAKTITLYQNSLLKNAELGLSSFQKAYEVDAVSFIDYYESEKMLFSVEIDYAKLLFKYHVLQAKWASYFDPSEVSHEE